MGRNEQQRGVFHGAFRLGVDDFQRIVPGVEDIFVELAVFFRFDFVFGPDPERSHRVQGSDFKSVGFSLFAFDGEGHFDRIADVIGVFFHQSLQGVLVEKVFLRVFSGMEVGVERQDEAGAAFFPFAFFDGVRAVTGGFPTDTPGFTRSAGDQGDLFRDHEGGIETNAELANKFAVTCGTGFLQFFQERFGAGFGNGADVFDDFVIGHADAIVSNRQGIRLLIRGECYFKIGVAFQQIVVGQ